MIPSQCTAAAYLSGVASALACPLIVGGHSKGGNLAEYAALVADESAFERLRGVFNHDGPSFLDDPSPRIDDDRFHALLHKTVPESSAFGMILERRADYRVVRSSAMSVFQHEPFTWLTEDDDFVYQEALNPSAVFFDEALDAWLRSKAPDERERFIDTIYELFASTEAGTWSEFQTKLFANTRQLLGARSKLDAETKSFIWQTLAVISFVAFVFLLTLKIRFNNVFLRFLGTHSFELYLIHGLFLEIFRSDRFYIKSDFIYTAVVLIFSLGLTALMYYPFKIISRKLQEYSLQL